MEAADPDGGAEGRRGQFDHEPGTFPGGTARLPRLSSPRSMTSEPEVMYVESAFLHNGGQGEPAGPSSGFDRYFSAESLFDQQAEHPPESLFSEPDPDEGPFSVLGVTSSSSWKEISRAHRALVSELHPDRYVDADPVVRAAAERRVRDVNEAYSEIRRHRSVGGGR
jgi:hypothetical protein